MKKRRLTRSVGNVFLTVFILLMAGTAYLEYSRESREWEQMKYIAGNVSAQTYEVLYAKLSKVETLKALVIKNDGGTEDFEKVARLLVSEGCVRNVLLAPGGIVSDVYPLTANEDVLGYNLLGRGAGDKEAMTAIVKGEMIMAGPFELVQGGMGISGRLPVYVDGAFWGIVSMTLDYPEALNGISSMQNIKSQGFGCELWRINADNGKHQSILSTDTVVKKPSYDQAFSVLNAEWHVTVYPEKAWYAHGFFWLCVAVSLTLATVAAIVTSSLQTIRSMDKEMTEYRIRELQTQLEYDRINVLLTQINSHFFHHTLNAIQALIVMEPKAAYKMTEDFSRFIRFKVDSVGLQQGLVPFREEMRSVRAYADMNVVQLGERLTIEYDVFDADFMIPVLTIQPIVENAIEHGIKPHIGGGKVRVSLRQDEDYYEVTVLDDGEGFTPGEDSNVVSVGIANIKTRMGKHPGCSIKVESEPGKGTKVVLHYPSNLSGEDKV
ncbi:MAG: hypothetical protein CVU91_13325 [Firmicutes bacterium HGW-Firmicutes-16]|nr:MAG: hypothetical protein CVU91_13325 [Firmicutes bacterium HGW-Firmicutes-16]